MMTVFHARLQADQCRRCDRNNACSPREKLWTWNELDRPECPRFSPRAESQPVAGLSPSRLLRRDWP